MIFLIKFVIGSKADQTCRYIVIVTHSTLGWGGGGGKRAIVEMLQKILM